jgi:dienelactone hydrolase/RimJ/RimL family protein N-acetyltransferase
MAVAIQKLLIQDKNLAGILYTIDSNKKQPGILLLSGSDGGIPGSNAIPESFIEYLVKNGFAVFALAYFGVNSLPPALENIPLEYFKTALQWLKTHPQIDPSHIGIIGQSRGAELALLLGGYFPEFIQAIVACSPSHLVCGGFPHPNLSAWTYQNKPITPFLPALSNFDHHLSEADDIKLAMDAHKIPYHADTPEDPCVISDVFLARYKMADADKAQIPIENIKCPLLLLSGDKDAIWPSHHSCELIMKKLKTCGKHLHYQNAGHGIISHYDGPMYHPIGQLWCKLGGTSEGNKIANQQSWGAINEFLKKNLSPKQAREESTQFHFYQVKPSQRALLHKWFEQEHIKEWMHGVGLQNTLNGLEKYFQGKSDTTYWIGYDKDTPFAFFITSPEGEDAATLDVFICDGNYLGRGLAVSMIRKFLIDHFSHMKRVLIDPEATNTRAIHVYKKVGFKIIGEFIASWHPVPHYQMELDMEKL